MLPSIVVLQRRAVALNSGLQVDEAALIRAAQAGDQDAFEQLVRVYDQSVLRLAMNLLRSPEDAHDVYQEAFLRVYRNLDKFRFDCSFHTWLYRIVTNLCLDQMRRRKVRKEEPAALTTTEGPLDRIDSVQEQLSKVTSEASRGNSDLEKKARDLATAIDAVLAGNSQSAEKSMGLNQANTELTAALHVAESSDRMTPSQALAVYAEAHKASSARVAEWTTLKQGPLADLNERLKAQHRAPIAIAEIEREVYYLMTR